MAFDSKDTAAFKGVWVFCAQREGKLMSTDFELISEGRKLADDLGLELCWYRFMPPQPERRAVPSTPTINRRRSFRPFISSFI